jgi:hypothetical protein
MVVLRRLDCVLEPTKDAVLAEYARLQAARTPESAVPRILTRIVSSDRTQPLYNISPYTFSKLLGDSENIAPNLVAYIKWVLEYGAAHIREVQVRRPDREARCEQPALCHCSGDGGHRPAPATVQQH